MNLPEELKYSENHEWIRVEDTVGYVGITDFAQGELGDIVYVDIEIDDLESVNADEVIGSVEAVKTVSDIYTPVSGKVIEVNELLESDPELVNTDPYGKGWLFKIELSNESELNKLLSAEGYKESIGK